eukprot:3355956-Amphidinium_carterae.1
MVVLSLVLAVSSSFPPLYSLLVLLVLLLKSLRMYFPVLSSSALCPLQLSSLVRVVLLSTMPLSSCRSP